MTPAELGELARLGAAATPGPWTGDRNGLYHGAMHVADIRGWGYLTGAGSLGLLPEEAVTIQNANAALIVAARNHLPALLQEIERLRTTEGLIEHNDFREIAEANAARLVAAREREARLREALENLMEASFPDACDADGIGCVEHDCPVKAARAALTAEGKP